MWKNFWEAFFIAFGLILGFSITTKFLHEIDPNIISTFYGLWSDEAIFLLLVLCYLVTVYKSK